MMRSDLSAHRTRAAEFSSQLDSVTGSDMFNRTTQHHSLWYCTDPGKVRTRRPVSFYLFLF